MLLTRRLLRDNVLYGEVINKKLKFTGILNRHSNLLVLTLVFISSRLTEKFPLLVKSQQAKPQIEKSKSHQDPKPKISKF